MNKIGKGRGTGSKRTQFKKGSTLNSGMKKKISDSLKGEKNPNWGKTTTKKVKEKISKANWKGGIIVKGGYTYLHKKLCEGFPFEDYNFGYNKFYVKKCDYIWFTNTGEVVKKPFLIHHKDRNKLNDNFENLEKMSASEHITLHNKEKKYEVSIDYPSEFLIVEATSKEEAEDKALEMIGNVTIRADKDCTAEAEEIEENDYILCDKCQNSFEPEQLNAGLCHKCGGRTG